MATTVARLEAVLSARTRDFDRDMDRSERKLGKVGKTAGIAGAAIFAGLAVVGKRGFDELKSQQAVTAQTDAVLKSMGKTAGVTAKDVAGLADAISKKSGIDDEAIQASENLLLTFRNLRNEVGEGNDIFTQATQVTSDLSVAFHKDLNQSAILVGKALNDPIKGLTSLQRIGIQFTASQKEQIKALVESGHTMQAQKLIMGELQNQTEGAAEAAGNTLAGQLAKAKNAFDDIAATMVTVALPALTQFAFMAQKTTAFLKEHPRVMKLVTIALVVLATALVTARLAQLALNLAVLANPYVAAAVAIGVMVAAMLILTNRSRTARIVIEALSVAIGLGLIVALVELIRNWRAVSAAAEAAAKAIGGAIRTAVQGLNAGLHGMVAALDKIIGFFKWIIDKGGSIGGAIGKIGGVVGKFVGDAGAAVSKATAPPAGAIGPTMGKGPSSISPNLYDELAGAQRFGLVLTSGYRPGAVTKHGTPSDHGIYPSHAIDVAGASTSMAGFFRWLIGQRDVKQAFYDPLGSIFNGVLSSYREGGHSDHVHVATYDKGGYLSPGWNLAYNGLGRPEPVGAAAGVVNFNFPNYVGSKQELMGMLREAAAQFQRRNNRPAFG